MSASKAARLRLTREYKTISANPPPYIEAHPSDSNILEWHYIITGPEDTPYHKGQYWGTLTFPPDYPFAPPAIRMHTPSGRFQTSTRLCLSISDFHPKSYNPAWEVSTILIGLLSFMTSDEQTTGSIVTSDAQKRLYASQSRWWNNTGGGSIANPANKGNVKAGDGGAKFREQWPQLSVDNEEWLEKHNIDLLTGAPKSASCALPGMPANANGRVKTNQSQTAMGTVVNRRDPGTSWTSGSRILFLGGLVFFYVLAARVWNSL